MYYKKPLSTEELTELALKRAKLLNPIVMKYQIPTMQIDDFTIETVFPPTANPFLRLWRWIFGSKYKRKILTRPPERQGR
jgi:hypothetical protein